MESMRQDITSYLQARAADLRKQARSRHAMADTTRNATSDQLKAAKKTAELMHGHELHGVSISVESAQQSASTDERIAAKLESEADLLSTWIAYLEKI